MLIREAWPVKEGEDRMSITSLPSHQPSYLPFDIIVILSVLHCLRRNIRDQLQSQ